LIHHGNRRPHQHAAVQPAEQQRRRHELRQDHRDTAQLRAPGSARRALHLL